jgi:hypothetical protein
MSIIALYVYSPTTFNTNTKIEPMTGVPHAAGEVKLPPGIYRLPGDATVVAANGAMPSDYALEPLGDIKGGWPDPPLQALQQHNQTVHSVRAFLTGTGDTGEI